MCGISVLRFPNRTPTNDAISRLGPIWRGVSNQLAVAAAPALEAVANAMAAMARSTGSISIAIRGLFDNMGRLTNMVEYRC